MIRLRAGAPLHRLFGLSILVVLGSAIEAHAQVDLNLQSRVETYSPPITALPPATPESTSENKTPALLQLQKSLFNDAQKLRCNDTKRMPERDRLLSSYFCITNHPNISQEKRNRFSDIYGPIFSQGGKEVKEQPTKIKVSFPFNPGYESNVLKSNQNIHPDSVFGFGGSALLTTAGANPYDIVAFSAGEATTRYTQFSSKSLDVVTTQGTYQFLINAFDGNGNALFYQPFPTKTTQHIKDFPDQNMISFSTLAFGFQNQTVFLPTFHHEQADLFTPQITLAHQNISLTGDKANECSTESQPKKKGFCYYADLSLTFGQTFSDVLSQQNANIAASATLGWRVPNTDWKITLPSVATARNYENVPGGRQDLLLQIGPTFTYAPTPPAPEPGKSNNNPLFSLSLAVTYNQNFSTISAAEWHGVIVKPTFTVAFQP